MIGYFTFSALTNETWRNRWADKLLLLSQLCWTIYHTVVPLLSRNIPVHPIWTHWKWTNVICVWVQHSWFSSFLIIRMQCIIVFRLDVGCHQKYIHFTSPNIPITMQQARSLCDKNVCHVSPATSGKKMFYRYIIISQIDPIQPCLLTTKIAIPKPMNMINYKKMKIQNSWFIWVHTCRILNLPFGYPFHSVRECFFDIHS